MATVVNDRDVLIMGTAPRYTPPIDRGMFMTPSSAVFKVAADGLTASPATFTFTAKLLGMSGTVTWSSTGGISLSVSGNTATLDFSSFSAVSGTITATITVEGQSYTATATVSRVADGAAGNDGVKTGVARLYQWASVAPAAPAGTSTFTWATVSNGGYTGADGWSATVPANPGTPGLRLYVASKPVSAAAAATTSPVSYINATVEAWSQNGGNGANGLQSATATVYQWAATIPAGPIGATSYTWATRAFGAAPSGWSLTPGTSPSAGMTLWAASVQFTDSAANSTTVFNWSSASVIAIGYAGTNGGPGQQGASYVTAYCASATGSATSAPAQTTGKTSLPAANSGGITGTWSATVPTLTAGQYLYQSDGIYDPTTDKVTWSTPYWSSLKVATLSAITANLGAINAGSINLGGGTFTVDNDGNLVCRSIKIMNPDGSIMLQAGGQLNPANAAPGTLNSDLTPAINSAAQTAVWSGVSGGGKPQDNATVGANASNFAATLGGDNLMNNSSFEVQSTSDNNRPNGYSAYNNAGVSATYVRVVGRTGGLAYGLRANANGASTFGLVSSNVYIDGTVTGGVQGGWQSGKNYVISFKAKKVNGSGFSHMLLQWNNAPSNTTWVSNPPLMTTWQTYTFRITWGSVVEQYGRIYIDCNDGVVVPNDEIHIDELIVQEGDVYSEWFPSSREAKTAADISSKAAFSPFITYDFSNTSQGWYGENATDVTPNANSITVTAHNSDPMIAVDNLSINGGKYDKIRARIRRINGSGWDGTLFYGNANHGEDGGYFKGIAQDPTMGLAATGWVVVEWDMSMSSNPADWAGATVMHLRLDLGSSASDVFEIDWIAIGRYGVGSDEAMAALSAIADDNTLSRSEKSAAFAAWQAADAEWASLIAQADSLGVSRSAYNTAHQNLSDYLVSIPGDWANTTVDSPINGATWRSKWTACYDEKQKLLNAIAAKAATLANWSGVSGTGKPADNATVSAADAVTALGFNPQFSDWTGTFPAGWTYWSGSYPVRETSNFRTPPYAVKYTVASNTGMYAAVNFVTPLPAGTFLQGSYDINILNNAGGGSPGYLIRLFTNSAFTTFVDTIVPVPNKTVSGWQHVPFTARVASGQVIWGATIYQMAAWSGMPGGLWADGSVCVFDNLAFDFYDSSTDNNVLVPSINSAATTATWSGVSGAGKPEDNATFIPPSKGVALNEDPFIEKPSAWTLGANISIQGGTTVTGAATDKYFYSPASPLDSKVETVKRIAIDPNKTYLLTANLYKDGANDRNTYIYVNFYDNTGAFLGNAGWGGTMSGYVFGAVTITGWARQGGQFGAGTGRAIPAAARTCTVGVWFNYSGGGSTTSAAQAAQDIRLEAVVTSAMLDPSVNASIGDRLSKSAQNILAGGAGISAGSLTWDSNGNRNGGYGVGINKNGIVAYDSGGNPTFTLNGGTGAAMFAGSLSGATGTFAGSLSAATGTFAGSLSAASGSFSGSLSAVTGNFYTLTIASGGYLRSSNFSSGSAGFSFNADGSAELGVLSIRGAPTGPVSNTFNPCTTTETTLVTLASGTGLTGAHKVAITVTGEIHSQSGQPGACIMTLYRGTAAGSETTQVAQWTAYASTPNGSTWNSTTTYVSNTYEFSVAADSNRTGAGVYFKVTAYVGSQGNVTSNSYANVTISTNVKSSTL